MRRVRQLTHFIMFSAVFMFVNACSLYSENDHYFLGDQVVRSQGENSGMDGNSNVLKREKIIQVAQVKMSIEEFAQAEPLKRYCEISGISFEVGKMPVTISHSGRNVYLETEIKDQVLFKEYATKVLKWWKGNHRVKTIEDKGLRLLTVLIIARPAKYEDIARAIFEFYQKNFQNIVISVICRELNSWVIDEYPNNFSVIIEKKEEEQKKPRPRRKRKRNKRDSKKTGKAAGKKTAPADPK